jgi:putative ABC transport system substrate-binding protein
MDPHAAPGGPPRPPSPPRIIKGQDFKIEERWADRESDLPRLAAALVAAKVDVIVTGTTPALRAVTQATRIIPIVSGGGHLLASGLIASLAKPGGNLTGLTSERSQDRLHLLRNLVPGLRRVAVLWSSIVIPGTTGFVDRLGPAEFTALARPLGLTVLSYDIAQPPHVDLKMLGLPHDDTTRALEAAFADMARVSAEGLIVAGHPLLFAHRAQILALTQRYRLPAVYELQQLAREGGLMADAYQVIPSQLRVAAYVLDGHLPADLPVEPQPFTLVLNLRTAKALGLTIPPAVLARADEVIE